MAATHFEYKDTGRAMCGQNGNVVMTNVEPQVTCQRCKRLRARMIEKEGLVDQPEKAQTGTLVWMQPEQAAAVRVEQIRTKMECMEFLREGDRAAAYFRLQRGFERQCRIAGIWPDGEKENAG